MVHNFAPTNSSGRYPLNLAGIATVPQRVQRKHHYEPSAPINDQLEALPFEDQSHKRFCTIKRLLANFAAIGAHLGCGDLERALKYCSRGQ